MSVAEIFLCACGLAADAFAAAVCKGTAIPGPKARACLTVGLWFGAFQAAMPALGWALGGAFCARIAHIDHWVAFALLSFIGAGMIASSFQREEPPDASLSLRVMLPAALATSIDALSAGVSFGVTSGGPGILPVALTVGGVTFCFSAAGVRIGSAFGARSGKRAQRAGGAALILLGAKILLGHLGFLPI